MKIALVYPPSCDPTAPYVALPLLGAWLRRAGHDVLLVDANVEAYDELLRQGTLAALAARLEGRLRHLERQRALDHRQQLDYLTLWRARGEATAVPGAIEAAVRVLRDGSGRLFYDPPVYDAAVATVEGALRLISAVYAPLELGFAGYRTPFALLDQAQIAAESAPDRNPFSSYFNAQLAPRLAAEGIGLVGLSVAFPGQLQPAYALAAALRRALPEVPVIAGGPAMTQLLLGLPPAAREVALGPFCAAVVQEGEEALEELVRGLARGELPRGVVQGTAGRSLEDLPAPDFTGLPLELYLSPEPVLPYDLSRGCYWGRCAFCHYGLSASGTACYRERPLPAALEHLGALGRRHGARLFYLSQDSVAPRTLLGLARAVRASGGAWRWSTDARPERFFSPACCQELAAGGALSVSLGLESGASRMLELMDKGVSVAEARQAIEAFAGAGIAAEVMCFTGFPGETRKEALATLRLLREERQAVALFICGEFALTAGSAVAARPERYGLREIWRVAGDELGTALFYEEQQPSLSEVEQAAVERALEELSVGWRLRAYPWAGSLSTAHTMLWYDRFGPGVFRELAQQPGSRIPGARPQSARASFDLQALAAGSEAAEAEIWERLTRVERRVSPAAYDELARALPPARPRPGRWIFQADHEPRRAPRSRPQRGHRRR